VIKAALSLNKNQTVSAISSVFPNIQTTLFSMNYFFLGIAAGIAIYSMIFSKFAD
jgi:F0F1-type ATP synthase membrane subunit c/vacuolar-type H+-ATPase subunit K